jgi:hypothetical protein
MLVYGWMLMVSAERVRLKRFFGDSGTLRHMLNQFWDTSLRYVQVRFKDGEIQRCPLFDPRTGLDVLGL